MKWTESNFNFNGFSYICKLNQIGVMAFIMKNVYDYYSKDEVIFTDSYIICKGKSNIAFCSHMDTVKRDMDTSEKKYVCLDSENGVVTSPQLLGADDRCGVYTLLTLMNYTEEDKKPWCIFTTDEEIGCVGAKRLTDDIGREYFNSIKFIVEIDRRGSNDCVFYSCGNTKFHKWIQDNTGYVKTVGSSSDCRHIGSEYGIGAVNLSAGYYNEHNKHEYMVISELCRTISTCFNLIDLSLDESLEKFDYMSETKYGGSYYGGGTVGRYDHVSRKMVYDDKYDEFDYSGHYSNKYNQNQTKTPTIPTAPTQEKLNIVDSGLKAKYSKMSEEEIKKEYFSQRVKVGF